MTANAENSAVATSLSTREDQGRTVLEPRGDWTIHTIAPFDHAIRQIEESVQADHIVIDLDGIGRIDTSGAYILGRATRRCQAPDADFHFLGSHPTARKLMSEVRERTTICPPDVIEGQGIMDMFARVGEGLESAWDEAVDTMAFLDSLRLEEAIQEAIREDLNSQVLHLESWGRVSADAERRLGMRKAGALDMVDLPPEGK